ncbi:MAG: DUF2232 domain-containing protein [Bacillota bacterium]|nr:DUF2232 domain-containing protein [Bacillota bacterium]
MNEALGMKQPGQPEGRTGARSLVEGALFAALASLFAVAGLLPWLAILHLAIPIPLTIVGYRYGLRRAAASAAVAVALTFLLSGSPVAVGEVIAAAAAGLVIAYGVRRGYPAIQTVLLASGAGLVTLVGQFFFSLWFLGINLWQEALKFQRTFMDQVLKVMRDSVQKAPNPATLQQLKAWEQGFQEAARQAPHMWPAAVVTAAFLAGALNYGIIRLTFRRLKLGELPAFPPFRLWRLPEWVGWAGLAAYAAGYADAAWHLTGAKAVFDNLFNLCLYAFLIEGLAVAWYYFDRWKVDRLTRWVIALFALWAFGAVTFWVVVAIGFLDIFLDYREPREGEI